MVKATTMATITGMNMGTNTGTNRVSHPATTTTMPEAMSMVMALPMFIEPNLVRRAMKPGERPVLGNEQNRMTCLVILNVRKNIVANRI